MTQRMTDELIYDELFKFPSVIEWLFTAQPPLCVRVCVCVPPGSSS